MLLVFAGIWALMQGIIDIVRAFEVRRVARGDLAAGGCPAARRRAPGFNSPGRSRSQIRQRCWRAELLIACDDRSPRRARAFRTQPTPSDEPKRSRT